MTGCICGSLAPGQLLNFQEFEPEPGMWAFDNELSGKPGRSLQIDMQNGRAMIVSYLGYRSDGSAVFLQASGLRAPDSSAFAGTLQEFRNGPSIGTGGEASNGEQAASLGPIQLTFDSSTTGTVTLPGDAPRRISRYHYEEYPIRFNNRFAVYGGFDPFVGDVLPATLTVTANEGVFRMQIATLNNSTCQLTGAYRLAGGGLESDGTATCSGNITGSANGSYRLERFTVSRTGMVTGRMYIDGYARIDFAGACLGSRDPVFAVVTGGRKSCSSTDLGLPR